MMHRLLFYFPRSLVLTYHLGGGQTENIEGMHFRSGEQANYSIINLL